MTKSVSYLINRGKKLTYTTPTALNLIGEISVPHDLLHQPSDRGTSAPFECEIVNDIARQNDLHSPAKLAVNEANQLLPDPPNDNTAAPTVSKAIMISNTGPPKPIQSSLQPFSESTIMAAIRDIPQAGHPVVESSSMKRRHEQGAEDDSQPKKRGKMVLPPRKLSSW
jgi:hypothetical protein